MGKKIHVPFLFYFTHKNQISTIKKSIENHAALIDILRFCN